MSVGASGAAHDAASEAERIPIYAHIGYRNSAGEGLRAGSPSPGASAKEPGYLLLTLTKIGLL